MQALALKYRPRNFDELIGQNVIAESLSHALDSGRISHAYLFSGLRGSGKTSSARIFAKALLCERGVSSHPCEICENCRMANEGRHMDIVEMDAASHRKIDDIRELIEQTKYAPSSARYKIFIIDEVHMLTKEAFNALLKTLEEPPEYIKFILATTDPLKLPATILSRTQHFRFMPISRADIIKHLEFILSKEGVKFELAALDILARSGSGSLRDTLTLLDQAIIYSKEFVSAKSVADMLGLLDPEKIEQILEVVESRDKEALRTLIKALSGSDAQMIIDELIANLKLKFTAPVPRFPLLIFERFFRILSEAKNMLASGADAEFVLYIALFMMVEAFSFTSIDDAIKNARANTFEQTPAPKPEAIVEPKNLVSNSNLNIQTSQKNPNYAKFLEKIYDRSFALGSCFDEDIEFVSFESGLLTLRYSPSEKNKTIFRDSSKVIRELIAECFEGFKDLKFEKVEKKSSAIDKLLNEAAELEKPKNTLPPTTKQTKTPETNSNLNPILPNNLKENSLDEQSFDEISLPTPSMSEPSSMQEFAEIAAAPAPDLSSANDAPVDENAQRMKANLYELNSLFGEPQIIKG